MTNLNPDTIGEFRKTTKYRDARKSARTKARPVTSEDIRTGLVTPQSHRQPVPGHIITLETGEGQPEPISIGDYIAEGEIKEIWRITADVLAKRTPIGIDFTDQRWSYYIDASTRRVTQFTDDTYVINTRGDEFHAKKGDWLVDTGSDWWTVESQQFEDTHDLF